MDTESNIEDELSDLLRSITSDLDPPIAPIVSGGIRRGQRLRRYNRIRGAAVAVTVLAVIVGIGVGVTGAMGGRPDTGRPSDRASTSVGPASVQPSSSTPDFSMPSAPQHDVQITTEQAEQIFASLLPPGHVTWDPLTVMDLSVFGNYFPAGSDRGYQVSFEVSSENRGVAGGAFFACSAPDRDEGPRPAGALPVGCQMSQVPGGGIATVAVLACDEYGFYDVDVSIIRPDGVQVRLDISNGTTIPSGGNPVTVSAPRPPVTADQLLAMAESKLWN
ncbi:MAG TPA: hypothetical protein VFR11_18065 [Micromonosporaceae bacterium]|jgi:hypothetical protein|nr:hypothetical protein [Micromonosporaceae bacterium]